MICCTSHKYRTGHRLLENLSIFCGAQRSITAFVTARYLFLSWARWIQPTPPNFISKTLILIVTSHLCFVLAGGHFCLGFSNENSVCVFLLSCVPPADLIFHHVMTRTTCLYVPHYAFPELNLLLIPSIAQSVQQLATGWTFRLSNPGGGEIFRIRPNLPRGPTQPPVQCVRGLSRSKAAGAWRRPPPSSSAEVQKVCLQP